MKKAGLIIARTLLLAAVVLLSAQCNRIENDIYKELRAHADKIRVVNTHEHQRMTEEWGGHKYGFYHLAALSAYLISDLNSAGAKGYNLNQMDTLSPDELWGLYGRYLDYSRTTSYYRQFLRGFKELYDFNDPFFTKENIPALSKKIEDNYKNYKTWFDFAFKKAGFEVMFNDRFWNRYSVDYDKRYFALVFNINSLIAYSSRKPEKGEELKPNSLYKEAQSEGYVIKDFDSYLGYCDHMLKKNKENGAVCLKNSQAYSRSIFYEDVSYEEAGNLYSKRASDLTPAEAKKIQDFMFHWIIGRSVDYNLPVQIHTGYLSGNGNDLSNGEPMKLNNLFLKFPEAKFILFHGGFPRTGEVAALGKMFPNVYLDLVWLPQISREEAINALDVMLDCVPYNKFFWGGDCQLIEESVGSLEFAKDVVAVVLAKRVKRGVLTREVATEILDRIFYRNAIEVFSLDMSLE